MKISNRRFKALTQLDLFKVPDLFNLEDAKTSLKKYNKKLREKKQERKKGKFTKTENNARK